MQQHTGPRFDIGEAVSAGWQRLWPNILPMAAFALVVWLVNLVFQLLQRDANAGGRFVFGLISFVVSQLVAIGWIKIALDITDGRPVNAQAVIDKFRLVVPYLIAALLYALMVTVGLVLLIVPGIIVAIVFAFYGFHIVDTGSTDPIGALRRSAEITRGQRWQLFLFGLLLIGLNLLGILLLIIGVLFTSAISLLAVAHVYRRLVSAPGTTAAPETP
ncbi:MAG TPA: hypothetical protein VFR23_12585 [Jiangellaceae bacterium]|nr:hypothetical protein [Jiangellaceae bacterium]